LNRHKLFTEEQKAGTERKTFNRINGEGYLQVKSQIAPDSMANKEEVVWKMNDLVQRALKRKSFVLHQSK